MSNRARLYILGASGHGAVLSDIAVLLGYREIVFCDDDPRKHGQTILGYPVVGDRTAVPWGADLAVGIGMNAVRGKVVAQAAERGWRLPVLVHPGAIVSPSATIGAGTVVMANVVVNARTAIGPGCILNTSCSVDHDCTLGSLVHIAPGVRLSGGVTVGDVAMLGIGSCAIPGVSIGANSVVGAGSTVVRDIPCGVIACGTPARVVRRHE